MPSPELMQELNQRLQKIENQLSGLCSRSDAAFSNLQNARDNEIDLLEVWNILWQGKYWIISAALLFAAISILYVLSLPNRYKAEVVLASAQEQSGGIGGLASQYSGLAAIAGINLDGGQSSDIDQAIALATSWPFLDSFVKKYDLKPMVMAVERWDKEDDTVLYDHDIYDPDSKRWKETSEPTSYKVFEELSDMVVLDHDVKTGLIRLSVEHFVPRVAYEWAGLLVVELNQHFQVRDIEEANQNISYLRTKINETSIAEMQSVFYRMIETQMKTLMLAEVSNEYLLKSVVPVKLPEQKSKPSRALFCLLGTVLGLLFGMVIVVWLHLCNRGPGHLQKQS